MSKTTKWIIVAVVIAAIIAAIIILKGKKASAATTGAPITGASTGGSTSLVSGIFPLKQGVTSDDVKKLQQHLNSKGASLDVDGIFGPKTEAALQLHYNMKEMTQDQFKQYVK